MPAERSTLHQADQADQIIAAIGLLDARQHRDQQSAPDISPSVVMKSEKPSISQDRAVRTAVNYQWLGRHGRS